MGARFGRTDPQKSLREAPAQPWSFWGVTPLAQSITHTPSQVGKLRQPHTGLRRDLPIAEPSPSAPPDPPWAGVGPPARRVRSGEQRALIAADSCCSAPARCCALPEGPRGRRQTRSPSPCSGARGVPAPLLPPHGARSRCSPSRHDHPPPTPDPGVLPSAPGKGRAGLGEPMGTPGILPTLPTRPAGRGNHSRLYPSSTVAATMLPMEPHKCCTGHPKNPPEMPRGAQSCPHHPSTTQCDDGDIQGMAPGPCPRGVWGTPTLPFALLCVPTDAAGSRTWG